jgi:hypothetical protein
MYKECGIECVGMDRCVGMRGLVGGSWSCKWRSVGLGRRVGDLVWYSTVPIQYSSPTVLVPIHSPIHSPIPSPTSPHT